MAKAETLEEAVEAAHSVFSAVPELEQIGHVLEDKHGRTVAICTRDSDATALYDLRDMFERLLDAASSEKHRANDEGAKVSELEERLESLQEHLEGAQEERAKFEARADELETSLRQITESLERVRL